MTARNGWSRDDSFRLAQIYGTRKDRELARLFGRSVEEIGRKARELGLAKSKTAFPGTASMPRWTDEQVAELLRLYPTTSNREIARALKRSVKSVVSKAHAMRLTKSHERLQEMGRANVAFRLDRRARK